MDKAVLDVKDLERMQKRDIRWAEAIGSGNVTNTERPLAGITREQRMRNAKAKDILNIGSGTRCRHCGLLYFCWVENCSACGNAMDYNLGHRDENVRL